MPFTSIPPAADRSVTAVSFKSSSSARNSAFWVSFAPGSRNRVTQRANRAAIVSTVGIGPVNLGADPTSGNAGQRARWPALPLVGSAPKLTGPMPTVETIAARFARCVTLFRDPGAKDTQKAEFRALLELLKDTAVTLRSAAGGIEVNGIVCEGASYSQLAQRLDFHGVAELGLPADPPAGQLFELFRVLADQPGTEDVARRLAAAGADRIRLVMVPPPEAAPPRPVASPDDFDYRDAMLPGPDAPPDREARPLGTEGILRGESWRDIKSVPISGVPLVTHDPPPPPAADALPESGRIAPPPDKRAPADLSLSIGRARELAPPAPPAAPPSGPAAAPPVPPPPPALPLAPAASSQPLALPAGAAALLAELERNRTAPMVGDVLAALVQHAETAAKQKRSAQLLG